MDSDPAPVPQCGVTSVPLMSWYINIGEVLIFPGDRRLKPTTLYPRSQGRLIRIFAGEGLKVLSGVKFCADSKNVSLNDRIYDVLAILANFGPKMTILVACGQE